MAASDKLAFREVSEAEAAEKARKMKQNRRVAASDKGVCHWLTTAGTPMAASDKLQFREVSEAEAGTWKVGKQMRWPWAKSDITTSESGTDRSVADQRPPGTEPVRDDTGPVLDQSEAKPRRSRGGLQWHPPVNHAERLLEWVQKAEGKTGWVTAEELEVMYSEMLIDAQWESLAWGAVGRELRKLLRQPKTYVWRNGKKVRTYLIRPS
jgi:hypothetical protein